MTVRGTILIGLFLCAALLAGTRLVPESASSGECEAIEIETNETGYKSGFHVFPARDEMYTWSAGDAGLMVDDGSGKRVQFDPHTIDGFKCILPAP
jgi:oxalate decarboxylase/phosphoglucose isomerase-like protein (cupin superfamily)